MPNLKDLRVRIASVKSTQKITSAMKMVAAATLRRAQEAAEASRPYAERMERMLGALAALDAIASEDARLAARPEVRALRAAALFSTGKTEAARKSPFRPESYRGCPGRWPSSRRAASARSW